MEIRTLQYFPGRRQGTEYDRSSQCSPAHPDRHYQCPRHRRALPTPDTGFSLYPLGASRHRLMSRSLEKYQLLSPTCEAFLKGLKEEIHLPGKD